MITFKEFTDSWGFDGDSSNILLSFDLDRDNMVWNVCFVKPRHEKTQWIEIMAGTSMNCEDRNHAIENDMVILRNYALASIQDLTKDIFKCCGDTYKQYIKEQK